ncbi:MAG: hypothetical protein SGJ07_14995 [Rhodospirillaceae bacterium]|nr:hypothetical protein [Rhodospirillaceae bacterium]
MNPELRRNLWIELTPSRLLIVPILLTIVLLLVWYIAGRSVDEVRFAARYIFLALVLLWGTRRAANALADEITGGTWDAQRMTALGPWSMSWGKFVGGTAYVWYASLICLAVATLAGIEPAEVMERLRLALELLFVGMAAMLTSFLVVLLHLRRPRDPGRRASFMAQAAGVAVGLLASSTAGGFLDEFTVDHPYTVLWYGERIAEPMFLLATQAALALWLGFGVYRAMCGELQKPTWPWGWPAVSAFVLAYLLGFLLPLERGESPSMALMGAAIVSVALFYAALLCDGKDGIRLRWFLRAIAGGDIGRAARLFPSWLFSFVLAAVLIVVWAMSSPDAQTYEMFDLYDDFTDRDSIGGGSLLAWSVAAILFMLRDTALVLWLNMSPKTRSPDVAAAILLAVNYGILPMLLSFVAPDEAYAIVMPWPFGHPAIAIAGPLATLLPIAYLLWRRWRSLAPHSG